MSRLTRGAMMGAAGGAAASLGVEDVFSTYLYEDSGSTQTITNGIDLNGEGGMVVVKARTSASYNHQVFDTERGASQLLYWNTTSSSGNNTPYGVNAFNSDGFDVDIGATGQDMVSWTFRKAPGFFDVVTYTGTGIAQDPQTISHNLGSTPGCIIVKDLDSSTNWFVYHRSLPTADQNWLYLNTTDAAAGLSGSSLWNPTSTTFTASGYLSVNTLGRNYVAYLFAHDEAIFGENADQSVIKCGTYTGTGSAGNFVNLGWEPQWLLVKNYTTTGSNNWFMGDIMRGIATGGSDAYLQANLSNAESTTDWVDVNPTGFTLNATGNQVNGGTSSYIYIAIRRGPMKTPTDATTVFDIKARLGAGVATTVSSTLDIMDLAWIKSRNTTNAWVAACRLMGAEALEINDSKAQTTNVFGTSNPWDVNDGINLTSDGDTNGPSTFSYINYFFKRAHGFMDVVAYTGDGTSNRDINHNLGVAPELIITKARSAIRSWIALGNFDSTSYQDFILNSSVQGTTRLYSYGQYLSSAPGASSYTINTTYENNSGVTFIAYLFATLPGISKVGSYTGTASNINVDCGFSAGARFVLIKRTDSTGDWYVWDTARGIVSGNDPYLLLNSTAAEDTTTDYIDPYASGFTVTSSAPAALNASGGTYLFLAIA